MNRAVGIGLVLAGAVLALFLPNVELLWFQGRPLGMVLVVLGAIDVATSFRNSTETTGKNLGA